MNQLKILTHKEKAEVTNKLKIRFGINEIPGILVRWGAERIYLFTGSFTEKDIRKTEQIAFIERIGIYFAKIVKDEIRLSIEGTQILKDQITKNIFELNDEQAKQWMQGEELNIQTGKKGFLVMKNRDDFLGCGKASELKIGNFIPKNRRLKSKDIIK